MTLPEMAVTAAPRRVIQYTVRHADLCSPFSVQVVLEQVFKDQRSTTIKDALENISGVRSHSNEIEGYVFNIRGFRTLQIFRNGLAFSDAIPTIHETANLESLEVLKGPASILYGRIEPGGIIHKTTKRPLDAPYYSLEQEFGSNEHYRTIWDATGPLIGAALAYRLSGAYQDSGSLVRPKVETFAFRRTDSSVTIAPGRVYWGVNDGLSVREPYGFHY